MSLASIQLQRVRDGDGDVRYRVLSSDFSQDHSWEEIGQLTIDRAAKKFAFQCTNAWTNERVVPPWVYGLPEDEMNAALAGEFKGFGYGAWTGRILSIARRLMKSGEYPETA
jgi:hypothetical protein